MARLQRRQKEAPDAAQGALISDAPALGAFDPDIINSMRRMITQLSYQDHFPNRLSVLAALRGEGVTYTTLAMATTLASDLAVRVCAVELNWWAPGMEAMLNGRLPAPGGKRAKRGKDAPPPPPAEPPRPGLAGVLSGAASLDEALVPTVLPNLMLLPAGELPQHQRPLVARSTELKARITQLSRRFDHVILDVPAVLSTSDTIALAALGEAACLVVRQGLTPMSNVRSALDEVKHVKMLGVIMNRAQIKTPRWIRGFLPQE